MFLWFFEGGLGVVPYTFFYFLLKRLCIKTEKVGFEPTEACTSSDFKSDAIDQLCHLSITNIKLKVLLCQEVYWITYL